MSIQLVTYANQTVTPTNDAIIYEKAVDQNGIFYGCNVTVTSNNVNITGGYGLVCGREFVINSESIAVTLAPSGTLDGRLYVRLDLADADAPIQLLTATGNTLPPLVQDDDVNYTNGTYEMELATFTVGVSSLSDVVETYEEIEGTKEALTKILGKCEFKTLLWENPSPSSAFSAQTIPLDLSGYDAVEIVFASSSSASAAAQYAKYPIPGEGFVLQNSAVTDRRTRRAKITATGVEFSAGYSDSTQYNNVSIPLKIYGVKLGL